MVRLLSAWSDALPPEAVEFCASPNLLMITKSAEWSKVHRPVAMDSIGVKIYDAAGQLAGERRFMGLFTSTAYSRSVNDIPVLRRQVSHVLKRSKFIVGSHNQKAIEHVLESRPRDELLQINNENLLSLCLCIINAETMQRTKLFIRRDPFELYISCLVYVLCESYDTSPRQRIQKYSPPPLMAHARAMRRRWVIHPWRGCTSLLRPHPATSRTMTQRKSNRR